jgi:EAL domain-containing protein (putative c-di-GMP-specific phosphodiesterase class I)
MSEPTQPDFVAYVSGEMRRHGVEADQLEIEITENASLHHAESVSEVVRELHALGVRLSLDDFGTGYSSLGYLRRYPFDKIKIDQSFVREMAFSPDAVQIVRAIIALANSFAMTVIAEGVETPEQLTALRAERCDEVQGHLAGKAVAPAEFVELLLNWRPGPGTRLHDGLRYRPACTRRLPARPARAKTPNCRRRQTESASC